MSKNTGEEVSSSPSSHMILSTGDTQRSNLEFVGGSYVCVSLKSIRNQEVILFSFLCSETKDSWERLHILSTVAVSEQPLESQGLSSTDA